MKTKIAIATSAILLTAHGFCYAPNNNLPKKLYAYEIFNLTESRHFEKTIKLKKAMKFESRKRLARLETLKVLKG